MLKQAEVVLSLQNGWPRLLRLQTEQFASQPKPEQGSTGITVILEKGLPLTGRIGEVIVDKLGIVRDESNHGCVGLLIVVIRGVKAGNDAFHRL